MLVVKGSKTEELSDEGFKALVDGFKKVVLDLGTGDGGFVVKNALKNASTFWIGIDPSEKSLREGSRGLQRKKIKNALLAVGSVERMPVELKNIVDEIYVNFPWGSLLQTFIKPVERNLESLRAVLKSGGRVNVAFGYDRSLEPSEVERLELPDVSEEYIRGFLTGEYDKLGLAINKFGRLEEFDNIGEIAETSWKKRLKNPAGKPKSGARKWFFMKIIKR